MDNSNLVGTTIVFDDAYTGVETYARLKRVSGDEGIFRILSKEAAGPNPRRVRAKPDARIAEITNGIGIVE